LFSCDGAGELEDTKGVIRIRITKNRQDNTMAKR